MNGEYLENGKCVSCPNGYKNSPNGATQKEQCYATLNGQEITSKYSLPSECEAGKYSSPKSINYGSMSFCSKCRGNSYSSNGATKCIDCDGEVDLNHTSCKPKTVLTDTSSILSCKNGEYLENNQCVSCPIGYANSPNGATSKTQCYATINGQEILDKYAIPTYCQTGTYNSYKKVNYGDTTTCTGCGDNLTTVTEGCKNKNECVACISGYVMNNNICIKKDNNYSYNNNSNNNNNNNNSIDIENYFDEQEACYQVSINQTYAYGKYSNFPVFKKVDASQSSCNQLEVSLVDANKQILSNATINIIRLDESGIELEKKSYTVGQQTIKQLTAGNYIIREIVPPNGYDLNTNDIVVKVGLDGTIYVQESDEIELKTPNDSRNVSININNKITIKEEKESELDFCYVKYGNGTDNEYCIGNNDTCSSFKEKLNRSNCSENPACYQRSNNTYVVGRFENQNGYKYYGAVCPACYTSDNMEYHWTSNPNKNDSLVRSITNEKDCISKKKEYPACYLHDNKNYVWGVFENNKDYKKIDNITDENSCINQHSDSSHGFSSIIIILLIIGLAIFFIIVYKYIKYRYNE